MQMKLTEYPHFAGSITISFRWFHPESYNEGAPWWQRHLTVHPIWTDPNQWTLRQRNPMRSRYNEALRFGTFVTKSDKWDP